MSMMESISSMERIIAILMQELKGIMNYGTACFSTTPNMKLEGSCYRI